MEKLFPFTFAGSGRTVHIRKLSALIRDEARRQARFEIDEPKPPFTTVDYGNGKIEQANLGHPIYVQLKQQWEKDVTERTAEKLQQIAIRRGVVCEIDRKAVAQAREDLISAGISTAEYDDHYVYVAFVCIGPYEDWQDLLNAVFNRAGPSEEAVQTHVESFRDNNQRETVDASES